MTMTLLQQMKSLLDRLANHGWAELFIRQGLDIRVPLNRLEEELFKPLWIDFNLPGFDELALDTVRAIEPGNPGKSLLYHALALSGVSLPDRSKQDGYPTIEILDTVENYIYAQAKRKIDSFDNPVIAVFAYQYRPTRLSVHRKHADMAFSRTGLSRVGTEVARYSTRLRGFEPTPAAGGPGFAVCPARFAAFIAEQRQPTEADAVLRQLPLDSSMHFLFPVHKIFIGDECLYDVNDEPIEIAGLNFKEFHINEKLRRIHTPSPLNPGAVPLEPIFNINKPPFVRTSHDSNDLIEIEQKGDSVLVVPIANRTARTVTQQVNGSLELVRFKVPKKLSGSEAPYKNRYGSSLVLPPKSNEDGRFAPEYANIRQVVTYPKPGHPHIEDLNRRPYQGTPGPDQFDRMIDEGGYEAAHFIDGTCDGVVSVSVPDVLSRFRVYSAFSIVSAIDYLPGVEQVDVEEWIEKVTSGGRIGVGNPRVQFARGGPRPLCDGRFTLDGANRFVPSKRIPNIHLEDPLAPGRQAFPPQEAVSRTATAIVGLSSNSSSRYRVAVNDRKAKGIVSNQNMESELFGASTLPDGASDIYFPGWDVSQQKQDGQSFYATYGLGSPFPEDAKLCAAINSFWPAVAPDSSRTFGILPSRPDVLVKTAIPMMNSELGYYEQHPRVLIDGVTSAPGWDGDFGPFMQTVGGHKYVNSTNFDRADQTRAAMDGKVGFSGLDKVTAPEMIHRMEELNFARETVFADVKDSGADEANFPVESWLVEVEKVENWSFGATAWRSKVWPALDSMLTGPGLILVFAAIDINSRAMIGDPPLRVRYKVKKSILIQFSHTLVCYQVDEGPIKSIKRNPPVPTPLGELP